jgi:hypothetical protein
MEINILKKKLKDQPSHHHSRSSSHNNTSNTNTKTSHIQQSNNRDEKNELSNLAVKADKEVDSLMHNYDHMPGMSKALPGMTPFKTWKMQQFLASADNNDDDNETINTEKFKNIATTSLKDLNEIRKKIAEVTINSSNNSIKNDKKNTTTTTTTTILPNVIKGNQAII